jgi:hypothetical protein
LTTGPSIPSQCAPAGAGSNSVVPTANNSHNILLNPLFLLMALSSHLTTAVAANTFDKFFGAMTPSHVNR